jgi:hypothetical protein
LLFNTITLIATYFIKLFKALNPPFNCYISNIKNFHKTNLKTTRISQKKKKRVLKSLNKGKDNLEAALS